MSLPITETKTPNNQAGLASIVAEAHGARQPVYPVGGGTSLDYGLSTKTSGIGLSLASLNRVVDYPARDMTITVEAGVTMEELSRTLAAERQWLPIEAPQANRATVGGVMATAWCGPRRFGWGTVRDYVIGCSAIDGRGMPFKGGGRVVKNVAGYDFCKLLTGSLGTLGVITQITFKIKPLPERSAIVGCALDDWASAERLLAGLVNSATTPAAIELVTGPAWQEIVQLAPLGKSGVGYLLVWFDGTEAEVAWMIEQMRSEWRLSGTQESHIIQDAAFQTASLRSALTEFSAKDDAPLVIKASLRPSTVSEFVRTIVEVDPKASVQAHAGTGIVIARFADFPAASVSKVLIGRLQPLAIAAGGHVVVLSSSFAADLTRQSVWGGVNVAHDWMRKVKQQFDPRDILNPGRFVYEMQ